MKLSTSSQLPQRGKAGALVVPLFQKKDAVHLPKELGSLANFAKQPIENKDFKAKEGEISLVYLQDQPEQRLILVGLGDAEKAATENYRRAFAALGRFCISKEFDEINLYVPHKELLRGMLEGLLLVNYNFDVLKGEKEKKAKLIQAVHLVGCDKEDLEVAKRIQTICEGVYFARDLTNGNADDVTPQFLAQVAEGLSGQYSSIKTTVFDKARIEKENLGFLLAVNQGSSRDPVFIISEYRGNPKSKERIVLVGKGITYDTGGLNLKPTGSMETMRADMGAAALSLAVLKTVAELKFKINFTIVVPSTENCIGSRSMKPGDIFKGYTGKTVEIANTDAEGRLVLADGLGYAVRNLNPTLLIDAGTLTGALDVAIGPEAAGLFTLDDKLANTFLKAADSTFERLWRLPLFPEYRDNLRSELADMKNVGTRSAGSSVCAMFLKEFVDNTPWVHLDIASVNYGSEVRRYHPKLATGFGVRLLTEVLDGFQK